jgi:hypothetical protein
VLCWLEISLHTPRSNRTEKSHRKIAQKNRTEKSHKKISTQQSHRKTAQKSHKKIRESDRRQQAKG